MVECQECKGTGLDWASLDCDRCGGTGEINPFERFYDGEKGLEGFYDDNTKADNEDTPS